ncbi:MAG TPA: hypothetical protein VH914_16555, partial [Acidimicrobiia bacterium]|nr:hypothetical protein [Acidimicrobiia bacterium]
RSVVEDRDDMRPPKVGVVIVGSDGQVLGESFRGEFMTPNGSPWHAEAGLLETRLKGVDLTGAVVYTTLEPCSRRGEGKTPCAERLVAAGVATVVIGIYDPNPNIWAGRFCTTVV